MQKSSNQTSTMSHKKSTKESPLVEVTKNFNAPVEDVFRMFTDENLIRQWWGPEGFSCPYTSLSFKEGGKYIFAMQDINDQNKTLYTTGNFQEIIDNRRIVMTDQSSDAEGNVISPEEAGFEGPWPDDGLSYITFEFQRLGDNKSCLHLSHENLPARMHDECVDGWSSSFQKIKKFVERH